MSNVLILGSGTQALALIKPLRKAGNKVVLLYTELNNYAESSKYVSEKVYCPLGPKDPKFLNCVIDTIKDKKIDAIIPMGDALAEFLSRNKSVLLPLVHFKSPDLENFIKGYDKNQLMSLCQKNGYPIPDTIDLSKVDYRDKSVFAQFPFSALLKPNCTTGGRGMTLINSFEDLLEKYPKVHESYGDCHLQKFIREGGRQVKVQIYIDESKRMVASSVLQKVRWYPVKGGASCCAVSIKDVYIVNICYKILCDIGWLGFADFDLIEDPDDGKLKIMEINPRVPACVKTGIVAGVNWAQIILDGCLDNPQKGYTYKEGAVLRHLGFDVLWFLHSKNRFKVKPSWFKFFGGKVRYQDFDLFDPMPFIKGTWHNVKRLFDPSFRKAKSGVAKI